MSSETWANRRSTYTLTPPGLTAGPLPSPGDRIAGRYELRSEIGRGGHGVVFEAYDHDLRRPVALKLLREDRSSEGSVRRFRREAALARDVQHRHIVRVFDLGLAGELLYLVMERVDGPTLARRIDETGRLSIGEVILIASQLLEALETLHRAGIVHRDVKPSNVLLESDVDGTVAKLGDLGVARRLDPEETRATLDGRVVGTLAYLPPEIVAGQETTERSDLYALGLTLLDSLVGVDVRDTSEALARVLTLHRAPPSPRTLRAWRPDLPRWLASWLSCLLEPEPARRYASATRALADLRRERAPGARGRFAKWSAIATLVTALAAASWVAVERSEPPFHGLRPARAGGIEAFDTAGRALWTEPSIDPEQIPQIPRVRIDHSGRHALAILPFTDSRPVGTDGAAVLHLVDPRDGSLMRRISLDLSSAQFSSFSSAYVPHGLHAVDLDGDGVDEILILLNHISSWPSIVLLYEPLLDRSRIVFLGAGHQYLLEALDLDGDGSQELLFSGWSSVLRRVRSITAVRIDPPIGGRSAPGESSIALNAELGASRNLLWQTVVDHRGVERAQIEPGSKTMILHATDGVIGQVQVDVHGSLVALDQRPAGITLGSAYAELREVLRLSRIGAWELAAGRARAAEQLARKGGDLRLAEVAARFEAICRIRAGEVDLGLGLINTLRRESLETSSIAYDAAEALHLSGRLDLAVDWYRQAMLQGGQRDVGRDKRDVLLRLILALCEQRQFAEAESDLRRFQASYGWTNDHEIPAILRTFSRQQWGAGGGEAAHVALPTSIGQGRELYLLALEANFAAGASSEGLLAELDRVLPFVSSSRGAYLSLRAALLSQLGRIDEALATAVEAERLLDPEHDLLDYALRGRNNARLAGLGVTPHGT